MKNLNSVCFLNQIKKIEPIEGADNIELAFVEGWSGIIKKDEFKIGDMVVCFTTDAVLPADLSEELNVTNYLRSKSRVRTVKLRGVYSECLIINAFSLDRHLNKKSLVVGDDLEKVLNVFKYEPPVRQIHLPGGKVRNYSNNPNFNVYHKFPNLKNDPERFSENDYVEITRKIHGCNARYGIVKKTKMTFFDKILSFFNPWRGYEFVYGSRMVEKGSESQGFYGTDVWKTILDKYRIDERLWTLVKTTFVNPEDLGSGVILYGEIYGPGIQGDLYGYGKMEIDFSGFDVEQNGKYLTQISKRSWFKRMYLPMVELLYEGSYNKSTVDNLVLNKYLPGTKVPHEGVVITDINGDRSKTAKVINPDYLIYSEKYLVPDSH